MSQNGNPATGAQTALYYVPEDVCNVVPNNPAWTPLRFTGGIPALNREILQSNELDGNREMTAIRTGSRSAQGTINFELSHLTHVDLFAAALQTTFVKQNEINSTESTIAFTAASKRISDSGGNDIFDGVLPGRKITVTNSSSNDKTFTVSKVVDTDTIEVDEALVDEGEGTSVTLASDAVMSARVGRKVSTFSLLIVYNDLLDTPAYDIVTGVEFTGFSLNLAVNAMATGSFDVIGRDYQANTALPGGSTLKQATDTRPYTGLDGAIKQDGVKLGIVTSMTPQLDNSANAEFAIGSSGVSYISYGRANNTFEISTAFTDYALFEAFINETQSRIALRLELDNNFLEFIYPRVQLTSGSPNPEGEGTITLSVGVQALRDPDSNSSVVISYNA